MLSMAESMKELLQQGIDLDIIDNEQLVFLIFQGMQDFIGNLVQKSKPSSASHRYVS
jgi:hypothetical protein